MAASVQRSVRIEIRGPLRREDLPGLSARACALLAQEACDVLLCEVAGIEPDGVALDALARLALAARRSDSSVALRGVSPGLRTLIAFAGLGDVLRG